MQLAETVNHPTRRNSEPPNSQKQWTTQLAETVNHPTRRNSEPPNSQKQ